MLGQAKFTPASKAELWDLLSQLGFGKARASRNIRSNAVAPGFIRKTRMTCLLDEENSPKAGGDGIPMKRGGQPEDSGQTPAYSLAQIWK